MAFFNPYTFVPAPPRGPRGDALPDGLRDGPPDGHHRWHAGRWTGRIEVTMRVITPLLVMRTDRENPAGHRHLQVATCDDGRVDLAPTQIKGMMRAAFEAATCSRFGVFEHHRPLGYRTAADGTELRPALVRDGLVVLPGPLRAGGVDRPATFPVTAWGETAGGGRTWLLAGFAHGDEIDAVVDAATWSVLGVHQPDNAPAPATGQHVVRGLLHATGPTIRAKRAERLVVTSVVSSGPNTEPLTQRESRTIRGDDAEALVIGLRELIADQRAVHVSARSDEISGRGVPPWEYLGHEPGRTAWSRHLYDVGTGPAPTWVGPDTVLPPTGDRTVTCWTEVRRTRLRPVMISRLTYADPPDRLLDASLHPADRLDQLSAADRVFGWTRGRRKGGPDPQGPEAHRGQLRVTELISPAACDAVEEIAELTLDPLSTPKPSQGRFYLGAGDGGPMGSGVRREGFFDAASQALLGRKVYPHHRELEGVDSDEIRAKRRYRPAVENGQPRPLQDKQNVTLHEWVRPHSEFRFTLRVTNLHPMELGALLWLLDPLRCGRPDRPARHRLGMGRPLGFGAVELTATAVDLCDGEAMSTFLDTLGATVPVKIDPSELAGEFEAGMRGRGFGEVLDVLRAALVGYPKADRGVPTPVRYPRNGTSPIYEWYVQNEKDAVGGDAQVLRRRGRGDRLTENR
ncbi:RAMP superfamily CRISPR-associated protein [Pseudonocardia sp. 73-21]|uniref:RAMP superfamily CRISPR-associated protein n=1 Tax=Pseudonocardia sp. 73-21 TaxID=1895809 RepID=UPI00095CC6D5|nr:RAMP superfamily CRISPR-associated protein [Pseudonocardia sp. 73-21]OJY45966.1 MAG: hypothetical protein BGP03_31375 [Pseudonocardia sp. 73-21]